MRRDRLNQVAGLILGAASLVGFGAAGSAGSATFPDDTYDITLSGDTVQVKTKGNKEAKGNAFGVTKSKKGSGPTPGIEARVIDKASGKSASLVIGQGGGMIQASRGNRNVVLILTRAGVEVFSYVGDKPPKPAEPKVGPPPDFKAPPTLILGPKSQPETTCASTDTACIARAIKKTIHDLSPEELAALITLLRDDLALVHNGDKILDTLRKLAGK